MPRVKSGPTKHARHKKVLDAVKGYQHANRKRYKTAHEAYMHAGQYAYNSRRLKKRDFRRLWIQRINAGLETVDPKLSYSVFMKLMKDSKIELNRKMLAEIAATDAAAFKVIVEKVYGFTNSSK